MEQLKQLGWVSVCHSHEHKWPVVNKNPISTPNTPQRNIVKGKTPFQHQASLPAVVLTTDNAELSAAARRKALFKKSTSTMGSGKILHHQRIVEDKVTEFVSDETQPPLQVGSLIEQPTKTTKRYTNSSSQQRPLSMMSLNNK